MKRKNYTEEQIIGMLKEHEAGLTAEEVVRKHGIAHSTFQRWKSKYSGMEVSEAKRLRELEPMMRPSKFSPSYRLPGQLQSDADHQALRKLVAIDTDRIKG